MMFSDFYWEENEKKNDVLVFDDVSDAKKVEVKDDKEHLEEEPKYGILRKISQKKEQEFLNHPSLLCVGVILVTLVKLFVQIFDMLTDTIISKSFLIWSGHLLFFIEQSPSGKKINPLNSAFRLLWFLHHASPNGAHSPITLITNANEVSFNPKFLN